MDLQSILNASDSSDEVLDEDLDFGGVDIEQILRESHDDDVISPSVSDDVQNGDQDEAVGVRAGRSLTADEILERKISRPNARHSHSASDWAILQSILLSDEEEDEDGDEEDMMGQETWAAGREKYAVSSVLNGSTSYLKDSLISDGSDDEAADSGSNPASSGVQVSIDVNSEGSNKENGTISRFSFYQSPSGPTFESPSSTKKQFGKEDANDRRSGEISRRAQANALSYEEKLLRSGQREMVSPLRVKRRLKQKIELTARGKESKQSSRISSLSVTRFGSSGIVENKTMAGVSTSLEKHSIEGAKVLCGLPTCLAFNSKFIAIGTQRGIVLIYDLFEVLRQRLGATYDENQSALRAGSVTSVDLSYNGEAVIAGHASGMIVLWDTIRGIVLRAVNDTHISPISSVRFMSDLKIVTVDVGGLVNKISFAKNMLWTNYSMETECLLDGTAGQILAMNVLPAYSTVKPALRPDTLSQFLRRLTLIALSSERSSFAVAVEPQVNVLHRWARPPADRVDVVDGPSNADYLPCLSWGWGLVAGGGNKVMPILARAWGCCLQLLCASFPTVDDGDHRSLEPNTFHWPAFGLHREVDTENPVVALEWLDERSLMYLTLTNEFTLVDTVMMTLLERLDFAGLKLVYAEFTLSRSARNSQGEDEKKPVATTTFQNSIRKSDDRLMVLCKNELKCISIVGARRRISSLEEDGEWLEALALALDHYESAVISQEDRRRDPSGKKDLSRHPDLFKAKGDDEEWLSKLLVRYLSLAVENAPEADVVASYSRGHKVANDLSHSHFQMLAGVCIEYCVVTRKSEVLFGPVFQRFHAAGYSSIFFEVLEPYVLSDKVPYIGAEAMSFFVEHCKATKGISTVERCLLHMDCSIMDFDSILTLLRRNSMYTALFYVYNNGLNDYISPLELLLDKVFDEADTGSAVLKRRSDGVPQTDFERLGYKVLLYLKICFSGQTFPKQEDLPEEKRQKVQRDLLSFISRKVYSFSRRKDSEEITGNRAFPFPCIRVLLLVDARAMLEVLSLGLDSCDGQLVLSESVSDDGPSQNGTELEKVPDRQDIVHVLTSILQSGPPPHGMTPTTLRMARNAFLDFTAKYILKGAVKVNPETTYLILSRKSNVFIAATTSEDRLKAQQEVMKLISSLPRDCYDPDDVLILINQAGMHRAALLLHQQVASTWVDSSSSDDMDIRCRHFRSAIDCYIEDEDPDFRLEVYSYILKECSGVANAYSDDGSEPKSLRQALFSKIPALCRLNPLKTTSLVADLFVDEVDQVIRSLDSSYKDQFRFLHAIASGDLAQVDPAAASVLILSMEHYHKYLSLMAQLHPEMVYDYLCSHDNYRTRECLELCEQHDIPDATVYLLERNDKVNEAIRLGLQTLESRMMEMKRTVRGMEIDSFKKEYSLRRGYRGRESSAAFSGRHTKALESLKRMLTVVLDVCERKSNEHGSRLWFTVLDRLITSKGFLRLTKEQPHHAKMMANVLSDLLRQTMQRMVSSVPLTDLVRKVTTQNSGSDLGELREMVESLLATYNFELQVFEGATTAFSLDAHGLKAQQRMLRVRGFPVDPVSESDLSAHSMHSSVLQVGGSRKPTLLAGDQQPYDKKAESSLTNALTRLRSRRSGRYREGGMGKTGLSLSPPEQNCYGDVDPVVVGPRPVRALGDAQHHGRLVMF